MIIGKRFGWLTALVALVGDAPVVDHPFVEVAVVADLDAEVRIGVAVVKIAPLFLGEEFDENFFVVPWLSVDVGGFFKALKGEIFFLGFVFGIVGVKGLEMFYNLLWAIFEALDVEGDFGANLMFGVGVVGVHVGIMLSTPMP